MTTSSHLESHESINTETNENKEDNEIVTCDQCNGNGKWDICVPYNTCRLGRNAYCTDCKDKRFKYRSGDCGKCIGKGFYLCFTQQSTFKKTKRTINNNEITNDISENTINNLEIADCTTSQMPENKTNNCNKNNNISAASKALNALETDGNNECENKTVNTNTSGRRTNMNSTGSNNIQTTESGEVLNTTTTTNMESNNCARIENEFECELCHGFGYTLGQQYDCSACKVSGLYPQLYTCWCDRSQGTGKGIGKQKCSMCLGSGHYPNNAQQRNICRECNGIGKKVERRSCELCMKSSTTTNLRSNFQTLNIAKEEQNQNKNN